MHLQPQPATGPSPASAKALGREKLASRRRRTQRIRRTVAALAVTVFVAVLTTASARSEYGPPTVAEDSTAVGTAGK